MKDKYDAYDTSKIQFLPLLSSTNMALKDEK